MIQIKGATKQQNIRHCADLIEPFCVTMLQKQYHTFFVYRCANYRSFLDWAKAERMNYNKILQFVPFLDLYWSAIDAIYVKIKGMPEYSNTKEYYNALREKIPEEKMILDFELFEIKLQTGNLKPILSKNTLECAMYFQSREKKYHVITVRTSGLCELDVSQKEFEQDMFFIKTHYGRKRQIVYGNNSRKR